VEHPQKPSPCKNKKETKDTPFKEATPQQPPPHKNNAALLHQWKAGGTQQAPYISSYTIFSNNNIREP